MSDREATTNGESAERCRARPSGHTGSQHDPASDPTPVPVLTPEQGERLWKALDTWQRVAAEAGNPVQFSAVNIRKSCLLGRLLYEGKPPLPKPPPCAYSAPWYSLIEEGGAGLTDLDIYVPEGRLSGQVVICQTQWTIVERQEPPIDGWLITFDGADRWMLRRYLPDEERTVVGHSIDLRGGEPETVYADWMLARRPSLEAAVSGSSADKDA